MGRERKWLALTLKCTRFCATRRGLSSKTGKKYEQTALAGSSQLDKPALAPRGVVCPRRGSHWIELAAAEKTLLAIAPMSRSVPTTITRITASITAYSAMSCPSSSTQNLCKQAIMFHLPAFLYAEEPKGG